MYSDNFDSVTNNLRNSANGTFVTSDDTFPFTLRDRSGQPDNVNSQEVAKSKNFIMGSDATEFVNRVNDQVRKRQKRMSKVAGEGEEHSIIWGMFMAVTMNTIRIPL